ncbi:MAG TPA: DUF309 domain-containing protein [Actinomycetes bacterium]
MPQRPRDAAGRPLPPGSPGVEPVEDRPRTPTEALAEADQLIHEDRPFAAHEVLEGAWKAAPEPERELWRGLAQIAVGMTHLQRGNLVGGERLLRRGAAALLPYRESAPHGLDVPRIVEAATGSADLVAAALAVDDRR